MLSPITELKTRARLLLNALQANQPASLERSTRICQKQAWPVPPSWPLRHTLNIVAAEAGFSHWEHARDVLSGAAHPQQDMGSFWYGQAAQGFTNQWFAHYPEAKAQLLLQPDSYLLPYKNQFFIAEHACIHELGLASQAQLWQQLEHDLVAGYGSPAWSAICMLRLDASSGRTSPASASSLVNDADFSRRVLHTFIKNGRINKIPQMRKKRLVILQWLVGQLEEKRRYPEKEINAFLLQFHEDFATLRREFIACKLMAREDGIYWRC